MILLLINVCNGNVENLQLTTLIGLHILHLMIIGTVMKIGIVQKRPVLNGLEMPSLDLVIILNALVKIKHLEVIIISVLIMNVKNIIQT